MKQPLYLILIAVFILLAAGIVIAGCSDPFTAPQEIVIGDSVAKTCKPEAKNENACVASGGFWAYYLDIGELIEDPIDDVLVGYCDCTPIIEL